MEPGGWFEAVERIYPFLVLIFSGGGALLLLWLATKFAGKPELAAACARIDQVEDGVSRHDARLQLLEAASNASPTRQELQRDMARLEARISGLDSAIHGLNQRLGTFNDYLHTLVERGIK